MKIIGNTTIHPFFFYTGKIAGYITWIVLILSIFNVINIGEQHIESLNILSITLASIGLLIILISLINLGSSTSLGVPSENTKFKENGLYKFSRNPMYLGFNFLTISSFIFTANLLILVMGISSLAVYHFIILGEERFLEQRFEQKYTQYMKKVRRYF